MEGVAEGLMFQPGRRVNSWAYRPIRLRK